MTSLSDHAKRPAPQADPKSGANSGGDAAQDPAKHVKVGEAEFLRQEADRARQAIANTWADAKANIGRGVDPRAWTGEHPWIAMGSAAVAGFFAAWAVIPSKEEQALKKLAKIEQALNGGAPAQASAATNGHSDGRPQSRGMLGTIFGEMMKSLGPGLASALSAIISAKAVQPDGADNPGGAAATGTAAGLDPTINPGMGSA